MRRIIPCISSILIAAALFAGCSPVPVNTPVLEVTSVIPIGSPSSWLQVYFTNPGAPGSSNYQGGPDVALAAAIDSAILSVDVAIYNINLWSIRDALIGAHRRGLTVRMVMESDNMDGLEVQDLIAAGIPIVSDQRESLMHDKFVVIDRFEVWTGSMNFTVGSAYNDNNNLLRIRSVQVAEDYTNEFEEMFTENHFGQDAIANTPHPSLNINGTPVEIYFSPDDGVKNRILELIHSAKESIHFLAYSFTSDEIGQAIISAAEMDLSVSGVVDEGQAFSNEGAEYDSFRANGLDVRLDGNEGLLHDKIIIIDGNVVITGSYNFTNNAETHNDENVVILSNPDIASQYMAEFQRIYEAAQP